MDLTAIIVCKDRRRNLTYCIESIRTCSPRPAVIVVDFGSSVPIESFINYGFVTVISAQTDVDLFHKARAINIGIKNVKTEFLCITDADQVFATNFFEVVHEELVVGNTFVKCETHFVSKIPSWYTLKNTREKYNKLLNTASKDTLGDGCCHGVSTAWANKVHGYDEKYIGYCAEDSDFALRAKFSGKKIVWITDKTSMIHLPHEKSGKYYGLDMITKNKARFLALDAIKNRGKQFDRIIANKNTLWGSL